MKSVLFYSSVKTKKMFSIQSYYRNDIQILRDLGYCVLLSNSIVDFFKFWKYDIGFYYFYRYSFFCALIAKCFGKKNYFTGGIDYLEPSFASTTQVFLQRVFFYLCNLVSDCNIIVSSTDENNIRRIYNGKLPHKCTKSFHVTNYKHFEYNGERKEDIITTIAWMVNPDNVFRKGVNKTILAFSSFIKLHPEYKLIIVGPGGKGSDIILTLIHNLGIEDKVLYLGTITEDEKATLLKKSRVYSQLSIYEGFGIASIEALAAGNIVVHSGNGGLKDAVSDYGVKVDISSIEEIVKGFEKAVNLSYNILTINNGIKYVQDNFSYPRRLLDFKRILQ